MLSITVLLIAMTLFSCNPDNPDDTTSVKKISIMGDSYSTFEGWSNIDIEGNPNEYWVYYPMKIIPMLRQWINLGNSSNFWAYFECHFYMMI